MRRSGTALALAFFLSGCDALTPAQYIPEVGYREREREVWWLGERYWSKQECVRQAAARFNAINATSPRRAFSWA